MCKSVSISKICQAKNFLSSRIPWYSRLKSFKVFIWQSLPSFSMLFWDQILICYDILRYVFQGMRKYSTVCHVVPGNFRLCHGLPYNVHDNPSYFTWQSMESRFRLGILKPRLHDRTSCIQLVIWNLFHIPCRATRYNLKYISLKIPVFPWVMQTCWHSLILVKVMQESVMFSAYSVVVWVFNALLS